MKIKTPRLFIILGYFFIYLTSCKKFIDIPPPVNSITTAQIFTNDAQTNSLLAGIYTKMNKDNGSGLGAFANGATTIFCGLSSDEMTAYTNTGDKLQFSSNALLANNASVLSGFWTPAYFYVYQANAIISGLAASTGVDDSARKEFTGEAKFIRAFSYFYLTNLFGDLPLALTTDFNQISSVARTPQEQIYKQIIQDLKDAQENLTTDYSAGGGERIRPNKWSAAALLARVYLYTKDWAHAEEQATSVISNSQYSIVHDLNHVFDKDSPEAIWQLQLNIATSPYNETYEGANFLPANSTVGVPSSIVNSFSYLFIPSFYLSSQLLNAFEPNDMRRINWIDSATINTITYYYPYKYIIGPQQRSSQGLLPQYYMMLRLAEQYLVRAEARAQQGVNLAGAASDLDTIRVRAGLAPTNATSQSELLTAIEHERQVEFFAEWGHRWFDLKRTGRAGNVLGPIKQGWDAYDELYPIPQSELLLDPALTQNTGY